MVMIQQMAKTKQYFLAIYWKKAQFYFKLMEKVSLI